MGKHEELSKILEQLRHRLISDRKPGNTFPTPGLRDMTPGPPLAGGLVTLGALTHYFMPGIHLAILAIRVAGRL